MVERKEGELTANLLVLTVELKKECNLTVDQMKNRKKAFSQVDCYVLGKSKALREVGRYGGDLFSVLLIGGGLHEEGEPETPKTQQSPKKRKTQEAKGKVLASLCRYTPLGWQERGTWFYDAKNYSDSVGCLRDGLLFGIEIVRKVVSGDGLSEQCLWCSLPL